MIIDIVVRIVLNGFIVDDDGLCRRFRLVRCFVLVADPSMVVYFSISSVPLN